MSPKIVDMEASRKSMRGKKSTDAFAQKKDQFKYGFRVVRQKPTNSFVCKFHCSQMNRNYVYNKQITTSKLCKLCHNNKHMHG